MQFIFISNLTKNCELTNIIYNFFIKQNLNASFSCKTRCKHACLNNIIIALVFVNIIFLFFNNVNRLLNFFISEKFEVFHNPPHFM